MMKEIINEVERQMIYPQKAFIIYLTNKGLLSIKYKML